MDVPRPPRILFAACASWIALDAAAGALGLEPGGAYRWAHVAVLFAAAGLGLARVPQLHGRERAAWALIGAGVLAWSLAELYYTAVLWDAADPPRPNPSDAGFLLLPLLVLAGALVRLPRDVPARLWVDGLTAALAVSAASAALLLDTVLGGATGGALAIATGIAYPALDLVLLALAVAVLASTGWRLDRSWILLAAGVSTFWLADSLYLVETAQGAYATGAWYDSGWWTGLVLVAAAAWQPPPRPGRVPVDEHVRVIAAPLGFGAVGLGLLVYGAVAQLNPLAVALAAACILAVMARATLTFAENVAVLRASRDEALTDALTGLGNRRALARTLDDRLREGRPVVLALFDLDGFKQYNDTFGHPAGDALLIRLAGNLAAFLGARGSAFRIGGDEFCALIDTGGETADSVLRGAAAALSEHGAGYAVGCSHGAIDLPVEASDAGEALWVADQRMYANKHATRTPF